MSVQVSVKRMFRIWTKVESIPLGEVPGGFRIDVRCGHFANEVSSLPEAVQREDWPDGGWRGLDGELVSGNDWVTIQTTAVMRLNGRLTIRAKDEPKARQGLAPYLIDMLYTGAIDLTGGEPERVEESYEQWRRGELPHDKLQVTLAISFELGLGKNQLNKERQREVDEARYARYARLGRAQYIAVGSATLEHKPYSPIKELDVTVLELVPAQALP